MEKDIESHVVYEVYLRCDDHEHLHNKYEESELFNAWYER